MTNEELLNAIRTGGNNSLLMELWNQNSGIIRKACGKFAGRLEPEDARQECFFAFTEAVKEYDPEAGATFAGYLLNRCVWHLSRYYEQAGGLIRIPVYQRQAIRKHRQFTRAFYQTNGRQPEDREVCAALKLSPGQHEQLKKDALCVYLDSLDAPLPMDTEHDLYLRDRIPDAGRDIEEEAAAGLYNLERRKAVWKAVNSLDKQQERDAVKLYYLDGLTYDQTGEVMGISRERVRVILKEAMRKLRTRKKYRELRGFVDLSIEYSKGIQGGMNSFNRTWTSATEHAALWILEAEERWKGRTT